jgi:mannosyltransferase OCH1-like enzyme
MKLVLIFVIITMILIIALIVGNKNIEKYEANRQELSLYTAFIENSDKELKRIDYPIYYINLDRSIARKNAMECSLSKISNNFTRISGIDGKKIKNIFGDTIDDMTFLIDKNLKTFSKSELGCVLSHIKAIQTAYDNGDDIAMICEDDLYVEPYRFMKSLDEIVNEAPLDWEYLNLFTGFDKQYDLKSVKYIEYDTKKHYSTVCYLINRSGMKKVLDFLSKPYYIKKTNVIDCLVSDFLLPKLLASYVVSPSVFSTNNSESLIHGDHVDLYHIPQTLSQYRLLFNNELNQVKYTNDKIPKIIHQTWKTNHLPDNFEKWSAEIKRLHPDWEYKLWTDEDNRDFIKENYSWFLDTYDNYDKNIKRVDAVRYFILYHYGGVYIDMDMTTLKNLDPIMEDGTAIFGYQLSDKNKDGSIANAFMACPPKHSLFKILIYNLFFKRNEDVLDATGPKYLTYTIRNYLGDDVIVYEMPVIYTHEWDSKDPILQHCADNIEKCRLKYKDSYTMTFWTGTWTNNSKIQKNLYKIPKFVRAKKLDDYDQLIPKNIIKIFINSNDDEYVPEIIYDCIKSWLDLNPEYNFICLNNSDCVKFLKKYFPEKVLKCYNILKPYAYKCDLARLCVLYVFGGVYSDLRMKLLYPLKEILKPDIFFCLPNDRIIDNDCKNPLCTGFIASTPNNPIVAKTIDNICNNILNNYYGKCPLHPTGPVVLGNTVREIVGGDYTEFKEGVYVWENKLYEILFHPGGVIKQRNKIIVITKPKHDEFSKDIPSGNVYWKMWKNKDIYNV